MQLGKGGYEAQGILGIGVMVDVSQRTGTVVILYDSKKRMDDKGVLEQAGQSWASG